MYVDIPGVRGQTRPVPAVLRTAFARVLLLGVFLIPIGLSSLRGLTHVLTCRDQVAAPFQVIIVEGEAVVTSAEVLTPGGPALVCGGLDLELTAATRPGGVVEVTVPIRNATDADWYGSVQLDVAGIRLPVDLGRVDAGETRRRRVELRLPEGTTEFSGTLLVGP